MNTSNLTLSSKLPQVGTTIFTIMSALANEHNAINLSQGFPDFEISAKLISLVDHYMKSGYNQYAPMQGVPRLREALSKKAEMVYGVKYDPGSEINITAGGTQAIYSAITAFIKEGDEVIVVEPAYDSYVPGILLNGGKPVFTQLKGPDYHIDWDEVKRLISPKTRMIMINSPQNPTGSVLHENDLLALDKITKGTDILIISDEVYEHLIFDGIRHESVCRYPDLRQRSLVIGSFGKTFHATGWKMGYVMAPENLMAEFRKAHQFIVFTCNTPIQYALADFIEDQSNWDYLPMFYQKKRDYFQEMVRNSRFKIIPSYGTYFQLLDYSAISDESELDFARRITIEFGVASIPVSVFYNQPIENKTLRFCFAKKEETLEKAAHILCKI